MFRTVPYCCSSGFESDRHCLSELSVQLKYTNVNNFMTFLRELYLCDNINGELCIFFVTNSLELTRICSPVRDRNALWEIQYLCVESEVNTKI